jgi:NAD(P)-dependent dehydrogenase (short-subunit alcohol dehydrogenase family)
MNRLKVRCALITGGTKGIGLETARQFLSESARVAITRKNPETLAAARKQLGSEVPVTASDASDVDPQKQVADTIRQAFAKLDRLRARG